MSAKYADEAPGGGLLARLYTRTSLSLLGLLAIAIAAALLGVTVSVFTHAFADPAEVTLRLERAGSQVSSGADVKLNGIIVGRVDSITATPDGSGATMSLALDRDELHLIPANVSAQVLPKTIFGEKYVDLGLPSEPAAQRLVAGDVIARDRSRVAIETSTVLNNLEPLLQAVSPAELNTTLTAIATAVQGRGAPLGETIADTRVYAQGLAPTIPQTLTDAQLLAGVGDDYTRASGPLVNTLRNSTVTARTLAGRQRQLADLLAGTQGFADSAGSFVADVGPTAVKVVEVSEPILQMLRKYSPELACTVRGVVEAKDRLEAVFADGPYLKARLFVSIGRGDYKPGVDAPRSLDLGAYGPYCPVTPITSGEMVPPFPPVPKELDGIRGIGNSTPLNAVNGVPGVPVDLGDLLGPEGTSGTTPGGTGAIGDPAGLVQMLLGGVLG